MLEKEEYHPIPGTKEYQDKYPWIPTEAQKKLIKAGKSVPYPTIEQSRAEHQEKEPSVYLTVRDETGSVVRRIKGSRDKGIHRVAWNLRYPSSTPTRLKAPKDQPPWARLPSGPLALPGTYTVSLAKEVDGVLTQLVSPVPFNVVPLGGGTFDTEDKIEVMAFQKDVARLQRAVSGAIKAAGEAQNRINFLRKALIDTPDADAALMADIHALQDRLNGITTSLSGDKTLGKRQEAVPTSINSRVQSVVGSQWNVTSPPTQTHRDAYRYAGEQFTLALADLRALVKEDLVSLEDKLEAVGAPWTPGRVPTWQMQPARAMDSP